MSAANVDLLHSHLAGAQSIDERYFGDLTLFYGNGLWIFTDALVKTVFGKQFFYRVLTGQQVPGQDNAVLVAGEGRAVQNLSFGICNLELPALHRTAALHGFGNFQPAILDIGKGDRHILMGLDFKLVDRFIYHPVFVLKSSMLVTGFLRPVGAGVKVIARLTVGIGDKGADLLGAGFVRIDSDMPAFHGLPGVGLFVEPDQSLLLIEPSVHGGFTGFHGHIMETQLCEPIIILRGQLHNRVPP